MYISLRVIDTHISITVFSINVREKNLIVKDDMWDHRIHSCFFGYYYVDYK